MPELISLTDAARRLGVLPKLLSDLLWLRELDRDRCPLIGRTRAVPLDYLPEIRALLVKKGKLPEVPQSEAVAS
jgi:hypothetical protein